MLERDKILNVLITRLGHIRMLIIAQDNYFYSVNTTGHDYDQAKNTPTFAWKKIINYLVK